MQNRLLFHQSSVSLEVIGLPDYSNNENKDQISIISQWKLNIIDKPLIEGKIDHLRPIMDAFYTYSKLLINNEFPLYESNLVDIKANNLYLHNIVLKSSKRDVNPLIITIGNSLLADIINCFDQLNESSKVKLKKSDDFNNIPKKVMISLNKVKLINFFLPPIIAICSLTLFSSSFIYFFNPIEYKEKNELINQNKFNSILTSNTIK